MKRRVKLARAEASLRLFEALLSSELDLSLRKQIVARQRALASLLYERYITRLNRAIKKASRAFARGEGKPKMDDIEKLIETLHKEVAQLSDLELEELAESIKFFYSAHKLLAKESAQKRLGEISKALPKVSLATEDLESIKALTDVQAFWVSQSGKALINTSLTTKLVKKEVEQYIKEGLGRKEMGARLEKVLSEHLTGNLKYTGSPRSYFEGLASFCRNQAASTASIKAYDEVGFATYKIVAIGDRRTCEECSFMDGKIFSIEDGLTTIARLKRTSPARIKKALPFLRPHHRIAIQGKSPRGQVKALASMGITLPPFHFRCRCFTEPVTTQTGKK